MKPLSTPGRSGLCALDQRGTSPLLSGLVRLAMAVLPVDSLLAAEVLDEVVTVANKTNVDTKNGRIGLISLFLRSLRPKTKLARFSAAQNLKDRLRRIVALAAIYQWKARELERQSLEKISLGIPPS